MLPSKAACAAAALCIMADHATALLIEAENSEEALDLEPDEEDHYCLISISQSCHDAWYDETRKA